MPQHGFLTITDTYTGNVSLKSSYVGTLNFGVLYNLNERLELYLETHVNYGLNNILTAGSKQVYQPDGVYNGTLASSQTDNLNLKAVELKVGGYAWAKQNPVVNAVCRGIIYFFSSMRMHDFMDAHLCVRRCASTN